MSGRPPLLSLILGFGPALLLLAFGALSWWPDRLVALLALEATRIWGASILMFLAGVRRGLSFFTPGGPRPRQVVTSLGLFTLGLAALLLPWLWALATLVAGYAAIAVLDPRAAAEGDAPPHFRVLRPPQMAVMLAGLVLALLRLSTA